jgi:ABC-type polysaccharide/polyol phosphate export permease
MKSKANAGIAVMRTVLFWTTPFAWPMMETGRWFGLLAQTNPQYYLAHSLRMLFTGGALPDATHTLLFFVFSTGAGAIALLLSLRVWRSPIPITVSPS